MSFLKSGAVFALGLSAMFMSCAYADSRVDLKGGGFVELDSTDNTIILTLPEKYRFEFDKFAVKQTDTSDSIVHFMNEFGEPLLLRIAGHTDSKGGVDYNHALGFNRAGAIFEQLVEKGVNVGSIEVMSFGKSTPLYSQEHGVENVDADAENRRAELVLQYLDK